MPTAQVPVPQIGPDLTLCTLYGLIVASDGVLTRAASVVVGVLPTTIFNVVRHVNTNLSVGHQEINAMNRQPRNQVQTDYGFTCDLQIFNVNNGNDPSPLISFWYAYPYLEVVWAEGTVTGAIYTNDFIGVRGDLEKPFEGRGEQLTTGHLLECDPGIAQYTRTQTG